MENNYLQSLNYFHGYFKKNCKIENLHLAPYNEIFKKLKTPSTFDWQTSIPLDNCPTYSRTSGNFETKIEFCKILLEMGARDWERPPQEFLWHKENLFKVFFENGLKNSINKYNPYTMTTYVGELYCMKSSTLKLFLDNGFDLKVYQIFNTFSHINDLVLEKEGGNSKLTSVFYQDPDKYQDDIRKLKLILKDIGKPNHDGTNNNDLEFVNFYVKKMCYQFISCGDFKNLKDFITSFKVNLDEPFNIRHHMFISLKESVSHFSEINTSIQFMTFMISNKHIKDENEGKQLVNKIIASNKGSSDVERLKVLTIFNTKKSKVKVL